MANAIEYMQNMERYIEERQASTTDITDELRLAMAARYCQRLMENIVNGKDVEAKAYISVASEVSIFLNPINNLPDS